MRYLLIGGKIDLAFEYPDKLVPDEDVSDRRPRVIRRHFGDATIDYSRPNGP